MSGVLATVLESLASNPYFSAGFGLVGIGAGKSVTSPRLRCEGAAVSRKAFQFAISAAHRRWVVSIELPAKDFSYGWFLHWMNRHVRHTQHLSLSTAFQRHPNGYLETKYHFMPSVGNHYFSYKGVWLKVERQRHEDEFRANSYQGEDNGR